VRTWFGLLALHHRDRTAPDDLAKVFTERRRHRW